METTPEPARSPTNVDDLFNYDVGLDEIFQEQPNATHNADASKPATGDPTSLGLGLDEEVKVTKKRQPAPKLDEARYALQPLSAFLGLELRLTNRSQPPVTARNPQATPHSQA
jgi:replication fork protection complex subunit Csm3/Swi3